MCKWEGLGGMSFQVKRLWECLKKVNTREVASQAKIECSEPGENMTEGSFWAFYTIINQGLTDF